MSVKIIAEIGINHNGSVDLAKQLIHVAAKAGADYVKFQKRTLDLCYTPEELAKPRQSPFGETNGDLKRALEFSPAQYDQLDIACHDAGIRWTASPWDIPSLEFIAWYQPDFIKIPSALITDSVLLQHAAKTNLPLVLSTGGSDLQTIEQAMVYMDPTEVPEVTLLACTMTYPCPLEEINLRQIRTLQRHFGVPVGFSSHSTSPWPCLGAVALGATMIEVHVTLDRTMFGSDQAASLEPKAFTKLCEEIRDMEKALGDGVKRVQPGEDACIKKLRRVR